MLPALTLACGLVVAGPSFALRGAPARAAAPSMDVAIVADAASTLTHHDPHTLATLIPDLIQTTAIAAFGLAGAYVTQGTEGAQSPRSRSSSTRRGSYFSDDYLPAARGRWDDDERWDDERWDDERWDDADQRRERW